jgi:uncharacterized protein YqeY
MLIDQIKEDSLVARKARETDKATALTTLYSEASMIGKNDANRISTDAEVIQTVKKFIKGIDETIKVMEKKNGNESLTVEIAECEAEKLLFSVYLPIQLREDELTVIINDIIETSGFSSMKDMGKVMGLIKENYDGMFDGKLASKIVRENLA